jgi:hypothetical protein
LLHLVPFPAVVIAGLPIYLMTRGGTTQTLGKQRQFRLGGALATKRRNRKRPSCGPLPPFTIAHPSSYRTI